MAGGWEEVVAVGSWIGTGAGTGGELNKHGGVTGVMLTPLHNGTKAELGVCEEGANWAKNGAPYILIFTAILSHMEHVKTLNCRYLLKESFFQTDCVKNVYFHITNTT
jgi:hypothetical protein